MNRSTRRAFLSSTAVVIGATLAAPYVKTAYSAGKLNLLLWDHWVPRANDVARQVVEHWGNANNVDVQVDQVDFVTETDVVAAGEARAGTGHDIVSLGWDVAIHGRVLEPVDDVVETLTGQYGPYFDTAAYLARDDGARRGIVAPRGSHTYPMASRLGLWKEDAGMRRWPS